MKTPEADDAIVGRTTEKFSQRRRLPRLPLIFIALIVGGMGAYALINSFAATPSCTLDLDYLTVSSGCPVVKSDTAASGDDSVIESLWGNEIQCADPSRVQVLPTGGDPHNTANGTPQGNTSYYQMQILDGDDLYGSRCELGQNERRYGENGGAGTFQLYQQGEHKITFVSIKLPVGFQADQDMWQTIMQMKQTEPDATAGSSPILELDAYDGKFMVNSDPGGTLWTTPVVVGQWVRFAFDVTYSQNGDGSLKVYADLNGNGNALDSGEQSPVINTATLATETQASEGDPVLQPGDPVPSHLRLGLYHDPSYSCPAPNGCTIDDDNVQVVDLTGISTATITTPPSTGSSSTITTPPPDTTPPTTSITSPTNGSTVSGSNVTVSANASDNVGVAGVQFELDGKNLGGEDTSSPYTTTWDTTSATNGIHTLTAVARDAAGNTTTSSSVTVTVSNSTTGAGTTPSSTQASIYWGAWMSGQVYGGSAGDAPWDLTTWDTFEQHAGKKVSIDHFGQPPPWEQDFAPGPLNNVVSRGAIPFMDMDSDTVSLSDIASGKEDSAITTWAKAVKSYGKPFFFRWDWEMNGTWFQWGAEAKQSPSTYVAAWKHIHDLVTAQGATNVTWVWCPNAEFSGSTPLASLYPGDNYVDWTCMDVYNWGTNPLQPDSWKSFSQLASSTYADIEKIAPSKPVMIGETASTEIGGSKASWITDTLTNLPTSFPNIKAFVWFNWNVQVGNGLMDWPIESSPSAQAAFASAIASPVYASNTFGNLTPLTTIQPLTSVTSGGGSTSPPPTPPPAPDTTPPTVSFSSPAANATVSGIVTSTAAASDNVGVIKVEFYPDGAATPIVTDTTAPYNYSFDSKTLANGKHTLTAKAYDAAGNSSSSTVTFTVNNPDTTPPSTPTNVKATATNATTVNLTWNASTDSGANATGVTKYNVLRNGVVIAQPNTTSYTDTSAVASTSYSYTIQAVDGAGNVSASSSVASVTTPAATTTNQDLLFDGTSINDYVNQSAPGAVTAVADPAGSGQTVFKMVVKNTDVAPITPTDNPRAQLGGPNIITNGEDFWWSSKVLLPSDFPDSIPAGGWFNLLEGAYGPPFNGSPPWEFEIIGDQFGWQRNSTYNYDIPYLGPQIVKNQWVSVMVHEKLASDGFIEMWINGQPVTFFPSGGSNYNPNKVSPTTQLNMQTWDNSNNGGNNSLILQSYRQVNMFTNPVTIYEWPMKIGTTKASVDNDTSGSQSSTPQPDTTPPTTPSDLMATAASATQVNLTWDASTDSGGSGLAGYNIYRNGTKLNSTLITTTSYGDSTVDPSTTYSYKIEAVDGAGNKSAQTSTVSATTPAAPDTTPPSVPANLKATAASSSQVNLTWNTSTDDSGSNASGLAGYNVYRNSIKLNTTPLALASYADTSVAANTTYQYAVQAVDKAGNVSAKTNTVSVITPKASTGSGGSGNTGSSGSGNRTGSNSGASKPSGPLAVTIVSRHDQPVANATVTIAGQTATTNSRGTAYFTSIQSGKQATTITSARTTIVKTVAVAPAKSSRHTATQRVTLSLTNTTLNPVLLLIPVVALIAGGLLVFRPWGKKFVPVTATTQQPKIISSGHPTGPATEPGRKLEAPGTIYAPTDETKDKE